MRLTGPEPLPEPPVRKSWALWEHAPQPADKILAGLLVFVGVFNLALTPVAPSLVGTHTVLTEVLRGSVASLITAGALVRTGDENLAVVLVAGLAGVAMFDWLYWWAGRRWGQAAIDLLVDGRPRTGRAMVRIQGLMTRRGSLIVLISYVLPLPVTLIDVAAGWAGMSLKRFVVLDLISAFVWVCGIVAIGYAIGQPAVDVAKQISHYGLIIGTAIVVVVVVRSARRG